MNNIFLMEFIRVLRKWSFKNKANYKQGDLDGLWSKFNVEEGLEWEVYYQKNSKQGFYKHYSNTGILLLEGTTINNQKPVLKAVL